MNNVTVYLEGERVHNQKNDLETFPCSINLSIRVSNIWKAETYCQDKGHWHRMQ